jgi:acyl transferase domain-containing protein/phosphopantetheinyl transferase
MIESKQTPSDVAIIGMACIFPGAPDLESYWRNIVGRVDAVADPPADWRADLFFDPESRDSDRVYCKRGGYLRDLAAFDPLEYGVMPSSIDGGEPDHFLALRVAHEALADAGYHGETGRPFDGDRVEVILGRGVYINRAFTSLVQHSLVIDQTLRLLRQLHPEHSADELIQLREELKASLPPFNAEIAPGLVPNILSGRIANRLDLRGPNFTIDAACASSLIAIERGMQDLLAGRCDMALVGGVQCSTPAPIHMIFCQLNALSRRGTIQPFAEDADGTVLGEGLGMMVLKRTTDARYDRDRIYAIIKAVGSASDGRALGLLAPRAEGEELAMRRAYDAAGVHPSSVGLLEAHGTGTAVGDQTEAETLARIFGRRNGRPPSCALGTVKSMIGHLLPAAGIAGMIKAALALHYKVLPPTLHCDRPDPKLGLVDTPLYINTETRPWVHGLPTPRRAGVNAFGFGGINAHAILEEFMSDDPEPTPDGGPPWDSEVIILRAQSRSLLVETCRQLKDTLASAAAQAVDLDDVAYTVNCPDDLCDETNMRLAIVASSIQDLEQKLAQSAQRLADPTCKKINDMRGIYFLERDLARHGKLAFLFPGEGSQYLNMLGDLCLRLAPVRERFDLVDRAFADHARNLLPSQVIFPPPLPNDVETRGLQEQRLEAMDFAAEAVFAASQGLLALLIELGIHPEAVVGHSGGEVSALLAAGVIKVRDDTRLIEHIIDINELYGRLCGDELVPRGRAVAVNAVDRETILCIIRELGGDVQLAMDNCPNQVVLCGGEAAVNAVIARLRMIGALCIPLPFQRPYHTAAFERYCARIRPFFDRLKMGPAKVPIYSAATAKPFPDDPGEIRQLAARQSALPVRFRETVEAMHHDGVRLFVEVGPKGTLTSFVADTLRGRPHLAIAANLPQTSGVRQLNCLFGQLAVHGVGMRLNPLYERRGARRVALAASLTRSVANSGAGMKPIPLAMGLSYLRLKDRPAPSTMTSILSAAALEPTGKQGLTSSPDAFPASVSPQTARTSSGLGSTDRAMHAYLASMDRFLSVQREVMHVYLNDCEPALPPGNHGAAEANNSSTSPQQYRSEVPVPASSPVALQLDSHALANSATITDDRCTDLLATVLEVIGERTGYPITMLAPTLDLEADLGIDSIKRVEILSALHRRTSLIGPDRMEAVASLKTISQVVDFLSGQARPSPATFPLIGKIETLRPGVDLVAVRELDTNHDLFLNDHALGGGVSITDAALTGLPLMPLTMTIELMAEAAASLMPEKILVEMREIRASKWLTLDEGRVTLRVTAALRPAAESILAVQVGVHVMRLAATSRNDKLPPGAPESPDTDDTPIAECIAILADRYPEPPNPATFVLQSSQPSKWLPDRLYRDHMFHGRSFRGIEAIEEWAENGAKAMLRVLPRSSLFAAMQNPTFLADPILLDAAGQIVGYWAAEHLLTGFNVFPYRVKSLQLFGPAMAEGQRATCLADIRLVGDSQIHADLDVVGPEGDTLMRVLGWEDLRVDFPDAFYRMCISPRGVTLSTPWTLPIQSVGEIGRTRCCTLKVSSLPSLTAHGAVWLRALAQLVLSRREREVWRTLKGPERRRIEWLLGRCCAKDAIRMLLRDSSEPERLPADIQIISDENGRPMIGDPFLGSTRPAISIAHADGFAVALASREPGMDVGIDLERVDSHHDGFENVAFAGEELAVIEKVAAISAQAYEGSTDRDHRREYALRFWCAKEAAAKALGYGLAEGPGVILVEEFDAASGTACLKVAGALAQRHPHLRHADLVAHTSRDGDFVFAFCLFRRDINDTV